MSIYVLSVLLINLLIYFKGGTADCPNGYLRHDDSCYKFFSGVKATWAEALMYCRLFRGYLAIIETEREQNYLEGLLLSEYRTGMTDCVWMDGTDALEEGEWQWAKTGQYIMVNHTYTKWNPGQPSSSGKLGEDCLSLCHHDNYHWDDQACFNHNNFLCEMPRVTGDPLNVIGRKR